MLLGEGTRRGEGQPSDFVHTVHAQLATCLPHRARGLPRRHIGAQYAKQVRSKHAEPRRELLPRLDVLGCDRGDVGQRRGCIGLHSQHGPVGKHRAERAGRRHEREPVLGKRRAESGIDRPTREQAEVHGEQVMSEARRGYLLGAHCTSGDVG